MKVCGLINKYFRDPKLPNKNFKINKKTIKIEKYFTFYNNYEEKVQIIKDALSVDWSP